MSLRVKKREGVAFLDALLLEVTSPAQKVRLLEKRFDRFLPVIRVFLLCKRFYQC
jgi:hypothetical protein